MFKTVFVLSPSPEDGKWQPVQDRLAEIPTGFSVCLFQRMAIAVLSNVSRVCGACPDSLSVKAQQKRTKPPVLETG